LYDANKYGHNIGVCAQAPINENRTIDQPALSSGWAGGSFSEALHCLQAGPAVNADTELCPFKWECRSCSAYPVILGRQLRALAAKNKSLASSDKPRLEIRITSSPKDNSAHVALNRLWC
jgi:hypothetical protein